MRRAILPLCATALVVAVLAGLCVGRYPLPVAEVLQALAHRIGVGPPSADATADLRTALLKLATTNLKTT